ncbi:hypothetical protein K474DRAFT_1656181 [Panus rudis PR-1116 ss-1]|nr:hypothetical protein K474DRAFT_1656181 [Panus rudis PR-1116 ss-1]
MVKKPKGKQKADPQPAPKPTKQAPEPDPAHDAPLPIPPPHSPRQFSPPVPVINVQSPTNEAWSKAPTPKLVTHNIDDSHSGHARGNQGTLTRLPCRMAIVFQRRALISFYFYFNILVYARPILGWERST